MKYHEIGERFEYNGVMLEVSESYDCRGCFFKRVHGCNIPLYRMCSMHDRHDKKNINYKLIEQCKPKNMEQKTEIKAEDINEIFSVQVANNQSDEEIYKSLLTKLFTTYKFKNADYGSAFTEMFDELGIDYAYGKLREKMNRIKVLRKQPNMVKNEGLEDALLDTAGYAILTLVELKKRNIDNKNGEETNQMANRTN